MKKIIHVNQHKIRSNQKTGDRAPVLTVKDYKSNTYAHGVRIVHQGVTVAVIQYSPDQPLSCGARVWIEVDTNVVEVETWV